MKKKISLWSLRTGLLIAGICFFLPLASVDCAGRKMMVYNGTAIVKEGYNSMSDARKKSALESMKPGISWRLIAFVTIPVAAAAGVAVSFFAASRFVVFSLPLFPFLCLLPYLLIIPLMSGQNKYISFSPDYGTYIVISASVLAFIASVTTIVFSLKRET